MLCAAISQQQSVGDELASERAAVAAEYIDGPTIRVKAVNA